VVHDIDGKRLAEYDYDASTQTATLLREYIWLEGEAVGVVENDTAYYVRTDHIGRPVFATDDTGAKVWTASYLPFGGVETSTGNPIELRFPGQWFQSGSGLHQNWMREYDPTTGRYLQADPLGLVDGPSVYGYALQNPGRYVDPRGEQTSFGSQQKPFASPTRLPFNYHPRTAILHPRDPSHQFPQTFDPHIWYEGSTCVSSLNPSGPDLDWGYYECRCVDGALNGIPGRYEIGVRVPFVFESPFGLGRLQPTVVHRFFRRGF